MEISHVALVMNTDGDLLVFKNKGRPTKEESKSICANGDLRRELNKVKKKMSCKDGTKILLALSIASDEMIRAVHMFPEVAYMDVMENTNKDGRDVFLVVGKDANRKHSFGNTTIIPL